jgi:hypothetical protein
MGVVAAMFIVGVGLAVGLIVDYVGSGLRLSLSHTHQIYFAITGLLLVMTSFMTFAATLLIHAAALRHPRSGADGR